MLKANDVEQPRKRAFPEVHSTSRNAHLLALRPRYEARISYRESLPSNPTIIFDFYDSAVLNTTDWAKKSVYCDG